MKRNKISIVTPCYNMEKYIEQTIKSVVDQGYSNLEYIIIDGGSTDKTLDIIKKYEDRIAVIVSEKDNGQYDAINKGLKLATGDIVCWLNADDVYMPWTLETVNTVFNLDPHIAWICGQPSFLNAEGELTNIFSQLSSKPSSYIREGYFNKNLFGYLQQESMFWKRSILDECGLLNLDLKLAADFELWTRFALKAELYSVELPLAAFRKHQGSRSKILESQYCSEVLKVVASKKKYNFFIRTFASKGKLLNRIFRLLVWKKTQVVFYSIAKSRWVVSYRRRPISNISFSRLLLELDR